MLLKRVAYPLNQKMRRNKMKMYFITLAMINFVLAGANIISGNSYGIGVAQIFLGAFMLYAAVNQGDEK